MALHNCATPSCRLQAAGRNIFCSTCWNRIPEQHRDNVRKGTEAGQHTLRAQPDRGWMTAAVKFASPRGTVKTERSDEGVINSVLVTN